MSEQCTPEASQRRHWYDRSTGGVPDQAPLVAARACPTCACPKIAGEPAFLGGVPAAAVPASTRPPRTAGRTTKLRISSLIGSLPPGLKRGCDLVDRGELDAELAPGGDAGRRPGGIEA